VKTFIWEIHIFKFYICWSLYSDLYSFQFWVYLHFLITLVSALQRFMRKHCLQIVWVKIRRITRNIFLIKILLMISNLSPLWRLVTWILICASLNHFLENGKVALWNKSSIAAQNQDVPVTGADLESSGVFKGRRARHLPRAPLFGGPPWGITRINFPYFWWKTYYSLT